VNEQNEEEIVSPAATSDEGDANASQVWAPRHYNPTSTQDSTEMIWKRFRLLSVISIITVLKNRQQALTIDGRPKRMCEECGLPGQYKKGRCIERWRLGNRGPGTACNWCWKKITRARVKDIDMNIPGHKNPSGELGKQVCNINSMYSESLRCPVHGIYHLNPPKRCTKLCRNIDW
jgi:hypothetical protein